MQPETAVSTLLCHALDSLAVGVIVVDLQGMITTINRAAERIIKLTAADAQGMSIDHLLATLGRRTSGLQSPGDRPQTFEHVVIRDEGPCHLNFRLTALEGDVGEHLGSVIIVDDVTQQKWQAEQTQRARWLNAMREMAASLAQAVRNPLGSMELFASMLKQELAGDTERAVMVEHILSGVKSLNHNISNLLLVTKCPILQVVTVDPRQLLEDSVVFAKHLVGHQHLRLYKHFEPTGVTIHAGAELLK
jgi:PAS domain S-box-containing protein